LIRGQCVRVGEQQHVGLCRDTNLDQLGEWDLDFCNKLLPTIIIINLFIIISFMVIRSEVFGQVMNTLVP
jgi:hypothetical protein